MVANAFAGVSRQVREAGEEMRPDVTLWQRELIPVLDLHQVQPERMRRDPASATNPALQHFLGPLHRTLAGTNGHQHPGDVAHHVMQEGIGADVQHDHFAVPGHTQVMDLLDRRLGLALPRAKGAEIVSAEQILRGFGHALLIQRPVIPGHLLVEVGRANLVVVDHITITPGNGLETRMEIRRHDLGPTDTDVVRQVDVGAHDPGLQRTLDLGVEMHHLATGVYAGVGTSRAMQGHWRIGDFRQGRFEGLLHSGHAGGLALPAAVARAFVFNAQRDPEKAVGRHFGGRVIYICQGVTAC